MTPVPTTEKAGPRPVLRRGAARFALVAFAVLAAGTGPALAADALDEAQRSAVEALIERYIAENPEKIVESVRAHNRRVEAERRDAAAANLVAMRGELLDDPASPVAGNPDGDVTVVEFFDYRCGYCKRSLDVLMTVMEEDPNLRVVFKEFPILSPQSRRAALAALAAREQGGYLPFHVALMEARGSFEDEQIFEIAGEVGLDVARLAADMEAPAAAAQIDAVSALATALDISGTPAFVVGGELFRGAIDLDAMRRAIAAARAAG